MFRARRQLVALSCFAVIICAVAVVGPELAPYSTSNQDVEGALSGPSRAHWFGTDQLGRDLFTAVLFGLRYSMAVASASSAVVLVAGLALGLMAGFRAGSIGDLIIVRTVDALLSIPLVIVAMVVVSSLGPSMTTVILAIAVGLAPTCVRVIRSGVIGEAQRDYVMAARSVGATPSRIAVRHVVPNVLPLLVVLGSAVFSFAILVESALSFLNLGPPPDVPTLGRLLAVGGQRYWATAPWLAILPGLVLTSVVVVVNLLGDALQDAADRRTSLL